MSLQYEYKQNEWFDLPGCKLVISVGACLLKTCAFLFWLISWNVNYASKFILRFIIGLEEKIMNQAFKWVLNSRARKVGRKISTDLFDHGMLLLKVDEYTTGAHQIWRAVSAMVCTAGYYSIIKSVLA